MIASNWQPKRRGIPPPLLSPPELEDKKRTSDIVTTTVGVVILWPLLFAVDGDDASTAELAA